MFNRKKVKKLEIKVRDLEYTLERRKDLVDKNSKLTCENADLTSSLNKARTQIRKQTEADLYFECAKIMEELKNGKKVDELQEQIDYKNALYASFIAQQQRITPSAYLSVLGSLGRGLF